MMENPGAFNHQSDNSVQNSQHNFLNSAMGQASLMGARDPCPHSNAPGVNRPLCSTALAGLLPARDSFDRC